MSLGEKSLVRECGCVDVYVCGGSVNVGAAVKNTMKIVIIIIDSLVIAYIQRCSLLRNRHTTLMSHVILNE